MAALTTLNITEKNANNSLSVTVKVNVTKEGVFTTTLSKEDVDKIHSYGIKLPTNRLGNEAYRKSRKAPLKACIGKRYFIYYISCGYNCSFHINSKLNRHGTRICYSSF